MTPERISCIIPFWNEGTNIFDVLDEMSKVRNLYEIICVDDASHDCNHMIIAEKYRNVDVVRLESNRGKSGAVKEGLKHAQGDYILLLDADLRNLNHSEIEAAIDAISVNRHLDMLILRRVNAVFFVRLYRADVLFTGERILRKSDLETVLGQSEVSGWQLESAINTWMFMNDKNVAWIAHSAVNTHKYLKWGMFKGLRLDLKTYSDMVSATGFNNFVKQIMFFAKEEIKLENNDQQIPEPAERELEEVH